MAMDKKPKAEFGDFQTPLALAHEVCEAVTRTGFNPASIIEPTCGRGAFLQAALEFFPRASHVVGIDRNAEYIQQARTAIHGMGHDKSIQLLEGDFFEMDWPGFIEALPKPILILGNPPWVTNAALGAMKSENLPQKANRDNLRGIEALTGKSNFDISEWMLRKNLDWIATMPGMLVVLCKTAVARKVLAHAWSRDLPILSSDIRRIDAQSHFGVSVDACALMVKTRPGAASKECRDHESLRSPEPRTVFGLRDGAMIADIRRYERWHGLMGRGLSGWRSGIKHDCSAVFELVPRDDDYENGLGIRVDVETNILFPLLKSSDLAKNGHPRKWLLVPQRTMASSSEDLRHTAPKAWAYLLSNDERLSRRGSSIYRGRPRFSIFGVGEYSFSSWKVAISGLYKKIEFVAVSPFQDRPVVMDDTCYFFACQSQRELDILYRLVQSEPAREFWSAFIFWDAKRPITAHILNLLDFAALSRTLGMKSDIVHILAERQMVRYTEGPQQRLLFRDSA